MTANSAYPVLPDDLASDIQQFSESQFARQYFSTHRTGFIFRRTVPVAQMMSWQKVCMRLVVVMGTILTPLLASPAGAAKRTSAPAEQTSAQGVSKDLQVDPACHGR